MISAGIVDYGNSNSGSLRAALRRVGIRSARVAAEQVQDLDLVVLPGVGQAGLAMRHLADTALRTALERRNADGRPILGICLGAQLMFEELEEAGGPGLGWIPGRVRSIEGTPGHHTGWSRLAPQQLSDLGLGRGIGSTQAFYFNHRFAIDPGSTVRTVAAIERRVTAVVASDHLVGLQFHPEKSQAQGSKLLRNLLEDFYGF